MRGMLLIGLCFGLINALGYAEARLPKSEHLLEIGQGNVDKWFSHTSDRANRLPDKKLGNEILYQLVIDRFSNGNPGNDCISGGRYCDPSKNDWFRFWGGDLRGVINKLDYLKNLGITRVWLTPIFENQLVAVRRHKHGRDVDVTAYHGYWIRDWFRLNPYFTDHGNEDFGIIDELIARAGPDMRFYLDSVTNHTSPADATQESLAWVEARQPLDRSDGVPRSHIGALFREGHYVTSLGEDRVRSDRNEHGYYRTFHRFGSIERWDNLWEVENFMLDGLSDLEQLNPIVDNYMEDAHNFWLDRFPGLAGYRMDTIKHVNQGYWEHFDRELRLRHPSAEVIGEYFSGGPYNADSAPFYRDTHMSMFDFDFRDAMVSLYLEDAPMSKLVALWEKDPVLLDARALVTFIDNHDVPRLRGLGMSYQELRQALTIWFASRGVPCVYYGLEQDLHHPGDPGDPYNRPMMSGFDESHELYRTISRLAELRKENDALRYGATHVVHETHHILAFERVLGEKKVLLVASKNPIAGSDSFEIEGLTLSDGSYQDVLTGRGFDVRQGKVRVDLRYGDIVLLSSTSRRQ